jgi:hypothetical protein
MQEVLSKTDDSNAPLLGQEFYELCLYDSNSAGGHVICVREAHARWDEANGKIAWDGERIKAFATLEEAKEQYAERRLFLAQKGFIYSDMDLL